MISYKNFKKEWQEIIDTEPVFTISKRETRKKWKTFINPRRNYEFKAILKKENNGTKKI